MVQLWVNLPAKDETSTPHYQTLLDKDIPVVTLQDDAGEVRVIAGDYEGHHGPAHTFTPINVRDIRLHQGHGTRFDVSAGHTLAIVVLRGTVQVNGTQIARDAEMVMLDRTGSDVLLEANSDTTLLLLSGEPIDEPIVGQGPFVMTSVAEINEAIADFNVKMPIIDVADAAMM